MPRLTQSCNSLSRVVDLMAGCGLVTGCLLLAACASVPMRMTRTVPSNHTGPFTTYWADDIKKEEGEYLEGKRHGPVRTFHADGSLSFEGVFEQGVPVGPVEYFHPGGEVLARSEVLRDGKLHGPVIEYDKQGLRRTEVLFQDGFKQGPEQRWNEDGMLVLEGAWQASLPTGLWKRWNTAGELEREEHYWNTDGRPGGYLETVYEGERVTVQTLMHRERDVWKGWVSMWHPNGVQSMLVEYLDGRREGRDLSWNARGEKLAEGQRLNDERTGIWTFYDEDGGVARSVRYEAGQEVLEGEQPAEGTDAAAGG